MYSIEELKHIYENRYNDSRIANGSREVMLYKKYRKLLDPLRHEETSKSLDIGCGMGYKTIGFNKDEEVLAIDISENAIKYCQREQQRNLIQFKCMDAFQVMGKYKLITAFGFSFFNTSNSKRFIEMFEHFYLNNLLNKKGSLMIIGSFTDFSGQGEGTWYLHTRDELEAIVNQLESKFSVKVEIVFPHKKILNYFGWGIYNFVAESMKLIIKRKRTFFIRIEHE